MKKNIFVLILIILFVSIANPVLAAESDTYVIISIYVSDEGYATLFGEYHGQPGKENAVALALDGKLLLLKPSLEKIVSLQIIQDLPDGRHTLTVYGFEKKGDEWLQTTSVVVDFMVGPYTLSDDYLITYKRTNQNPGNYRCMVRIPEDELGNPYTDWTHDLNYISNICRTWFTNEKEYFEEESRGFVSQR